MTRSLRSSLQRPKVLYVFLMCSDGNKTGSWSAIISLKNNQSNLFLDSGDTIPPLGLFETPRRSIY